MDKDFSLFSFLYRYNKKQQKVKIMNQRKWRGLEYPEAWVKAFNKLPIPNNYITTAFWCKQNNITNLNYVLKRIKEASGCKEPDKAIKKIKSNTLSFFTKGKIITFIKKDFPKDSILLTKRYNACYRNFIPFKDFCRKYKIDHFNFFRYFDLIEKKLLIITKKVSAKRSVILVHKTMMPKSAEEIVLKFLFRTTKIEYIPFYKLFRYTNRHSIISRQGAHQQLEKGLIPFARKIKYRWYVPANTKLQNTHIGYQR